MKYVRLYAGPDGDSHFEDVEVEMAPLPGLPGYAAVHVSDPVPVSVVSFRHVPAGEQPAGWHNAPRRQFVVNLVGGSEIETSDGAVRRIGTGEVVLAEDTTGKGHVTRHLGSERLTMTVPLADQAVR